MVINLTMV